MKNIIYEERGNTTIISMGIIYASLIMLVLLSSILSIYLYKRQLQTAADAASLAAARTLGERYKQELNRYRDMVLKNFNEQVEKEAFQKNGGKQADAQFKKIKDEIIDRKIHNKELAYLLKKGNTPSIKLLQKEVKYPDFNRSFSPTVMGDLLYKTANRHWQELFNSASGMAAKNSVQGQVQGAFPVDKKPKILITVRKSIQIPVFDNLLAEKNRNISLSAAAIIDGESLPLIDISRHKIMNYNGFGK